MSLVDTTTAFTDHAMWLIVVDAAGAYAFGCANVRASW